MKLLHALPPYNFPGVEEQNFSKAKFVILPVPYDGTASWGSGAKDGPHAIIAASRFLELFDHELGRKPADAGFFTLDELEPARGDAKETVKRVADAVSEILARKKTPVTLGGDHSIAIGAIQAAASHFDNLSVVAFDAHLDAWDEFEGSDHSHASVGARIADITPSVAKEKVNEVIIGARTTGKNELEFCRKNGVEIVWAEEAKKDIQKAVKKILPKLRKNVYITFDFDCLDPGVMPAVGTPEPEGLQFNEAVEALKAIAASRNIVGMDFCELSPMPGNRAPDFLAAKLVYKAAGLALGKKL
jgi:agmatinase